ncbi:MAG TPA: hypothetical protein VGC42_01970 [Kofleriaceae bacterium]
MRSLGLILSLAACGAPVAPVNQATGKPGNAVLLFAGVEPRLDDEPDPGRVFQPLLCVIDGVRQIGERCGEIMPAHATIRGPHGALTIARSTVTIHDTNGEHDYPPPYGPACCMYNTCVGHTMPYRAAPNAADGADPLLAVWPPDADIALALGTSDPRGVIRARAPLGSHGFTLLATTDVDHDGHPELIALERWSNDYGLDVFGDAAEPLYHFSCGNI